MMAPYIQLLKIELDFLIYLFLCSKGSVYPDGWLLPSKTKSQAVLKAIDLSKSFDIFS